MIVPVNIRYRELEDLCYWDDWEKGVVCDDLKTNVEVSPEDVIFEYMDIEEIVGMYLDDVIDILLSDKNYRKKLEKRLHMKS